MLSRYIIRHTAMSPLSIPRPTVIPPPEMPEPNLLQSNLCGHRSQPNPFMFRGDEELAIPNNALHALQEVNNEGGLIFDFVDESSGVDVAIGSEVLEAIEECSLVP